MWSRSWRIGNSIALVAIAGSMLGACSGSGGASAAPVASAASASPSAVASEDPASVQLLADVDVSGRKIHISCIGTAPAGVPTAVFEAGLGGSAETWNPIYYGVGALTRLCAYDRAGLGLSDPVTGKAPTTADQVADLHAALEGAKVSGPYLLGGHSLGAWNMALFTSTYPDEVVALVFVDPRGPRVSEQWLAALPASNAGEPDSIAANREELTVGETDPALNPEGIDLRTSAHQAIAVLDPSELLFGDRPVIVLGGGHTRDSWADLPADVRAAFDTIWLDGQKELAGESTRGSYRVVPDADHDLMGEFPDEVVKAVQDVLGALRS